MLFLFFALVAAAAPQYTFKPDSSVFVDDAFALRSDGKGLAWISTDGASAATLHLSELGGAETKIDRAPSTATALRWLSPTRVLVVWRDPENHQLFAQSWTQKGADENRLGPADLIELGSFDGKPAVLAYARVKNEHVFSGFRADSLKPIPKKVVKLDRNGLVNGSFKPLWVERGLSTLVVKREGEYDKSKDMKRPDRLARYDVFNGKFRDEQEIGDLIAFVHVQADHGKHPGEDRFAHISDDRAKLLVVNGFSEREVTLARPLSMYDPETLHYQALDDGRFALSLTVDPMNPPALQRKKADPAEMDLYLVDDKGATLKFRLDTKDRPATWQLTGNQLVVLRKSKGFDRGGVQLEIYPLTP